VSWYREKIRSEGGGFRSEAVRCGGKETRERERDRHEIALSLSGVGATNFG
jgi:hypothetical protein